MSGSEQRAARVATVSALIVVAGFVAAKAARDAILLSSFRVQLLPLFMAISAVLSLPIILVAGKLMTRWGPARLMPALNGVSAAAAIVEWWLLARYPAPTTVAIYLHLSISGAVLVSGFWSIVNERFDVQTAKRHIGRIGMGATLGGIAGGVIAERSAVYLSHDKILLVLAAIQAISALALYGFGRGAARPPLAPDKAEGTWFALRAVTRSRLLRNVGGIVVLGAISAGVLDYVFKADIVHGASKSGLLRSLALFYTTTNIITAIFQVAICGPLVARLGVPRSVAVLPFMTTALGALAIAVPVPLVGQIARGGELVTRNSVYRAGYELLYAPLAEESKRPTKIVLDVGADRLGDLIGAQLVAILVYVLAEPRGGLLIAVALTGAIGVLIALRLPRSYTHALEQSLLARGAEAAEAAEAPALASGNGRPAEPEPWITLTGLPTLGQAGDQVMLARRRRERSRGQDDRVIAAVRELRSGDVGRIKAALARPLTPELATHAIELVALDDVAREALVALHTIAARCTGALVDALLDPTRDVALRRRLPAVLLAGEPSLAAWGLWRGLLDPSFDVRYRCGAVLARLAADGHLPHITPDEVFETVRREFLIDREVWKNQRLVEDLLDPAHARDDDLPRAGTGLEHVFTVLGLVLPAEPLRIALHAVQTDDPALRGTALEYLESILPPDVRAQLWPLLEGEGAGVVPPAVVPAEPVAARARRSHEEILAELNLSYPSIVERLRHRADGAR